MDDTISISKMVRLLEAKGIKADSEHVADSGADYGLVMAWEWDDGAIIQYGDNAETHYTYDPDGDMTDLAAWLEDEDLSDWDRILQTAVIRGLDALGDADPDAGEYAIICTSHNYGGDNHHGYLTQDDGRGTIRTWPTIEAAKKFVAEIEEESYCTGHNETGRPTYTAVND